jgi:hypothetical protein
MTLLVLGILFGAVALLGVAQSTGSRQSRLLTASVPWLVWKVVGALAIVAFIALFLVAVQILRNGPDWGLTGPAGRKRNYLIAAAFVVALIALLIMAGGGSADIPVNGLVIRTRAVLFAGMLAVIPWLALVWLAQAECRDLQATLTSPPGKPDAAVVAAGQAGAAGQAEAAAGASGAVGGAGGAGGAGGSIPTALNARLLLLWKLLTTCVTAFAVAVVAAIVNSGALRASFLNAHPARSAEFPPSNVLFYGAFFAVILSVITIPLVAAWRACATTAVERTCPLPPDGQPTDDWVSARARLEKLLHLDVPLLRNPLTALSIFVPLITAALAAFIPQLGTG